jgi:hypothetical protein
MKTTRVVCSFGLDISTTRQSRGKTKSAQHPETQNHHRHHASDDQELAHIRGGFVGHVEGMIRRRGDAVIGKKNLRCSVFRGIRIFVYSQQEWPSSATTMPAVP